jgi:hypothetical protein
MQIQPPDTSTPLWQYVAYVAGTIVLAMLIPPVRARAIALFRSAPKPGPGTVGEPFDRGDEQE